MDDVESKEYLDKMRDVLAGLRTGGASCASGPCQLADHVYIGGRHDARSPTLLKVYGITHVLNCAAEPDYERDCASPYSPASGLRYMEFEGRDNDGYPILTHYGKAKEFMDEAREEGGKVLVHCEMGINRSAAICVAYILEDEQLPLLDVVKRVKRERRVILVNEGFQRQLVEFARQRELLYKPRVQEER